MIALGGEEPPELTMFARHNAEDNDRENIKKEYGNQKEHFE